MRIKILAFSLLLTIAFVFGVDSGFGKEKAQDFELVDISGKSLTLSENLGKVVLLDFFATWCGPCIMEIEQLQVLYSDYSSDQLVILSISVDAESDSLSKLQLFAQQNQMQWTVARDTDNVNYNYGVSAIPHLVLVDTEGYESYSHIGVTAESTLRSEIDALISENVNGDSGNSDVAKTDADYSLYAVVAVCCIALFIIGIIVAKNGRKSQKTSKKAAPASDVGVKPDSKRLLIYTYTLLENSHARVCKHVKVPPKRLKFNPQPLFQNHPFSEHLFTHHRLQVLFIAQ